jgi:hypothetical protein|tara:strand:- start:7412 stop:7645 length:234 start_codon:yes stop_codon:yes gene_type:complete
MDNNITNILERLSEKRLTHPNIVEIWREYIDKKVTKLNLTIQQCLEAIKLMDDIPDISQSNILALYNLTHLLNIDDQ